MRMKQERSIRTYLIFFIQLLKLWTLFRFVFQEHGGIYVAYIGAFLIALFLFARTLYYCTLSVSTIDGPM